LEASALQASPGHFCGCHGRFGNAWAAGPTRSGAAATSTARPASCGGDASTGASPVWRFGLDQTGADAIFAAGIYNFDARILGGFPERGLPAARGGAHGLAGQGRSVDHFLVIEREGFTLAESG
jgi:hypothetical protein